LRAQGPDFLRDGFRRSGFDIRHGYVRARRGERQGSGLPDALAGPEDDFVFH
jgi:hypothetical protein